jgi:hypothetical protein
VKRTIIGIAIVGVLAVVIFVIAVDMSTVLTEGIKLNLVQF